MNRFQTNSARVHSGNYPRQSSGPLSSPQLKFSPKIGPKIKVLLYRTHSHKLGLELFQTNEARKNLWAEIDTAISSISDDAIIEAFEKKQASVKIKQMSISKVINDLIKERLKGLGWKPESRIFQGKEFGNAWRLDFSKQHVSVEVGFNHGSDAAWNVIKPTMASQINHIEKEVQTDLGVIVTATSDMKVAGGFDNAIGTFDTYEKILYAMQNMVTVPLVIIGLEAPLTFRIEVEKTYDANGSKRSQGYIIQI
jgi:hypothetical protein